jgi:hypothetical protein
MNRTTLDRLVASGGLVIAALLVASGALLTWAHSYVHDQVRSQLVAQKVYFPPKGSDALKPAQIGPYLNKYAGQQLTTGAQAKAYADHFIAVHLNEIGGGQTYAQLSTKAQANPTDQKLAAEVDTMFRGETLRGLLLNGYAFDTVGNIAGIAALVSFIGAGLMGALGALGFVHARRINTPVEPTTPTFPVQEMINS